MRPYAKLAWSVLGWNLVVIAWGAFVRATGSGAGCGSHWPLCNGEVVPRAPALETIIEFSHRATSGIALLLVVALVVGAHRAFPAGHPVRKAAWASLGIMLVEALLGAGLVVFGWVVNDASFARAMVMGLHLVNTFLLLGALTFTAEWATRPGGLSFETTGLVAAALWAAFAAMCVAGVLGAVTALGDTLMPATPFAQGLALGEGVTDEVRAIMRIRIAHPLAALLAAAAALIAAYVAHAARPEPRVRQAVVAVAATVGAQLLSGVLNVWLMAPVWMQLVHLVLADLVWIALVLLAAATLAPGDATEAHAPDAGLAPART